MAAMNFKHIIVKDVGSVAVVDFINSQLMFGTSDVEEIGAELTALISDHGRSKIVLDFSNVQYVSSTMLAKLASLERQDRKSPRASSRSAGWGRSSRTHFVSATSNGSFHIYDDVERRFDLLTSLLMNWAESRANYERTTSGAWQIGAVACLLGSGGEFTC